VTTHQLVSSLAFANASLGKDDTGVGGNGEGWVVTI